MTNKKIVGIMLAVLVSISALSVPKATQALSGTNLKKTKIKVNTRQGGDWFLARVKKTNDRSVLEVKDVLPGRYKMSVSKGDQKSGQTLAVRLRMLDDEGRRVGDGVDVDLSVYVDSEKVFVATVKTEEDGWLQVSGLSLDTQYELDVKDDGKLSKKKNEARIKTSSKINRSKWFVGANKQTEKKVLKAEGVLPGTYKFNSKDLKSDEAFTLKAKMLNEKGREVDEAKVKIYTYVNKVKTFVGEVVTDEEGWVTLPGVTTGVRYKLQVKE
jgi:5-hydroxyisourate hydrolase-like protein (transthyretin family)